MDKYENHQELYKVSVSTGKMQVWKGCTIGDRVICSYGQLDGKMQTSEYRAEGKNIGKVNESTDAEQATIELEAMYDDQITNKHYRTTKEEAIALSKQNREPRKITNYKDRYDKMPEVLLTSVKKNGSRGCVLSGKFYSKIGRPEEVKVPHLRAVLEELGELATFDSEIFAEGLSLQRVRSAWLKPFKTEKEIIKVAKGRIKKVNDVDPKSIKTQDDAIEYLGYNPNDDAFKLKFYVFDIPDTNGNTYLQRVEMMEQFEEMVTAKKLGVYFEFLYPKLTHSHEERMSLLKEVCDAGSEGLVHYEINGVYEFGKRSTNVAKSKPRYDAEALVVGVEKCRNGEGKLLLKACDELDNVSFKAMMKGTHESRMYGVQEQYVGQWVTFEYEELSEAGCPTKPVVQETRLCDTEGNPLS